jgi:heme exporter protein A
LDHPSPSAEPRITFENIEKRYGAIFALRRISASIGPGEFVALLGPNGAGKTTLLRLAALLVRPTSGRILVSGQPLGGSAPARTLVGMVSHASLLYDELSAAENLDFFARLYGLGDAASRVTHALESAGLAHRAACLVRTFSRGMRQRLSIARALLHQPSILLLDEPATGLDRQGLAWLATTLEKLRNARCTVLMSTHTRSEALALASRAIWLMAGQVAEDSGPHGDAQSLISKIAAGA